MRAFAARDWDAVAALYAPEAVLVDHRSGVQDRRAGRDAIMVALQGLVDVLPDLAWEERPLRTAGRGLLASAATMTGTSADGGEAMATPAFTLVAGEDGLLRRVDIYDTDEEALRRLEMLAVWQKGMRQWTQALADRSRHASEAFYAPDCHVIDHRAGISDEFAGRERLLKFWRLADAVEVRVVADILDADGLVCATTLVMRGRGEYGGAWATDALQLILVDGDGITHHVEIFDADAFDALHARFAELVAAQRERTEA
jgi:ketosteroid isomerase-like protein